MRAPWKSNIIHNLPVITPAVLIICVVLLVLIPLPDDNFRINMITELIGVVITIIVVDQVYSIKGKQERSHEENKKILNLHNLLTLYIDNYFRHLISMVNPDGQIHNTDPNKVKLNDLRHIYSPVTPGANGSTKKVYELYFSSLEKLTEAMKLNLPLLNDRYHPELISIFQDFIMENDTHQLKYTMQARSILIMKGESNDPELLRNAEADEPISPKNKLYLYKRLLENIRQNNQLINRYVKRIHSIEQEVKAGVNRMNFLTGSKKS